MVAVNRLTQTIVEVVVKAPLAAKKFKRAVLSTPELRDSGAHRLGQSLGHGGPGPHGRVDRRRQQGFLGTIVLEMGAASAPLRGAEAWRAHRAHGPHWRADGDRARRDGALCGGGLGSSAPSIARAFKAMGSNVLYFAGYKKGEDLFKQDDIERFTDQAIWVTDTGKSIEPRRAGRALPRKHRRGDGRVRERQAR